ncbi:hypothetical protein DHX103_07015 [Planococcus sp. X10-3]|uniref:hypothetical protein n=1 Tax=Planococcus sp. X10-3 TaxID=3061240 RepID=UPI003BB0F955
MFLIKRKSSISDSDLIELQTFVSKTIESMLMTKEETLNIFKAFDMVLICTMEGNYVVTDVFQLSKFTLSDQKNLQKPNIPFYTAARSLGSEEETIVYLDVHKEKGLRIKNLQAFYYICELLDTMEIDVVSPQEFKCFWS